MKLIQKENKSETNQNTNFLYSFDIFDTLITRKVATPAGIFALICDKLKTPAFASYPASLRRDFFLVRINTEKYMRILSFSQYQTTEITIDEIYNRIGEDYSLTNAQVLVLKNLELDTEVENFIPIEENINKLKNIYSRQDKVVLISDMYLQSNILREFLRPFISFIDDIEIFVSCEAKCSKGDASLFKYVSQKLGVSSKNWYHIGDNPNSDYIMAKEFGINAEKYDYPGLETYEKTLLKNNEDNSDLQKIIGECKAIGLTVPKNLKTRAGISLGGPVLTAYVRWLLFNSIQKGITRLYFIARDGYILKEIADILIARFNLPIRTKYIYVSRQSLLKASVEENNEDYYEFLETMFYNLSIISSETMDMSKDELLEVFGPDIINKKLNLEYRQTLKDKFRCNKRLREILINRNKKKKELVIKYLQQEIDFSDNNFAFVDLAGTGRTNSRLAKIINTFFDEKPKNFYMFTNRNIKFLSNITRYLYLYKDNIGCKFLELLCRAPHGQTLGYKCDRTGRIIPVFDKINEIMIKDWDYNSYLNEVKLYARYSDIEIPLKFVMKYIEILGGKDPTIIEVFSDELFAADACRETIVFAPVITKSEALMYLLFNIEPKTSSLKWSCARSKKTVRKIIEFKKQYGSLLKYLIHINFSQSKKMFLIRFFGVEISLRKLFWRVQ